MAKRLRIFAGPNGSGKSTYIKDFHKLEEQNIYLGFYVNADDIEHLLKNQSTIDFTNFGITVDTNHIQEYFKLSTFAPKKLNLPDLWKDFTVKENILSITPSLEINSYIAADLAEYIRQQLVEAGHSFSYETVMSAENKIDFLIKAKEAGYWIYLYFFCTKDPLINISRVNVRVAQNGHSVPPEVIEDRYYRSLSNLKAAVKTSRRAYLFDNSNISLLVAEVTHGTTVNLIDENNVPDWVRKYLID